MASEDKKYQVFVSSTYQDLQKERQEVMHALLELDCIPSGMELFPAANEDQWSLIKGVIDDCDYYIMVLGGRYGSIGPDGYSYTEMEYRYAVESGKPVIAFLHGDPSSLPAGNCEATDDGRRTLAEFRELAQKKMCKFWTTAHELGSVVSRSLIALKKQHPGAGWVRGDKIPTADATAEILKLRKRIEELEADLIKSRTEPPKGASGLASGFDEFDVRVRYTTNKQGRPFVWEHEVAITWDDLFFAVSPLMLHEASTRQVHARLSEAIADVVKPDFDQTNGTPDPEHEGHSFHTGALSVDKTDLETMVVQFMALGYIERSTVKNRSVKDRGDYWTLTPYGTTVMNQLRAVPHVPKSAEAT